MSTRRFFLALLLTTLGCSSSSSGANTSDGGGGEAGSDGGSPSDAAPVDDGPTGPASITITSPTDGAKLTFNGEPNVPVAFTVTQFHLLDPSQCGAQKLCGTVWIKVDGDNCNEPIGNTPPRNAEGTASPIVAHLEYCFNGNAGAHTIDAELHDSNGVLVMDSASKPARSTVHITAVVVGDDGGTD
jgi:hypothetical protein